VAGGGERGAASLRGEMKGLSEGVSYIVYETADHTERLPVALQELLEGARVRHPIDPLGEVGPQLVADAADLHGDEAVALTGEAQPFVRGRPVLSVQVGLDGGDGGAFERPLQRHQIPALGGIGTPLPWRSARTPSALADLSTTSMASMAWTTPSQSSGPRPGPSPSPSTRPRPGSPAPRPACRPTARR
jgi:hypothetical protein